MTEYSDEILGQKKRLKTLLIDVLNCGSSLGWTELGKYTETKKNISLREAIQNELSKGK